MDGTPHMLWNRPRCYPSNGDPKNTPQARSSHTLSIIGSTGFLFGGLSSGTFDEKVAIALDELHILRMGNAELEWCILEAAGLRPLARWRHSASVHAGTRIIVFGGYHTAALRLSDLWFFDTIEMEWKQPRPTQGPGFIPNGSHPPAAWPGASHSSSACLRNSLGLPAPRGGHSATIIGNSMFVFGGYGGYGYARRDLDDLHRLDIENWLWSRTVTKGRGPERRSGHQACAVETSLFLFGGWNAAEQFSDLYVLDTIPDQPVWSCVKNSFPAPRWNLAACSVMAIPSWKVFAYGGVQGSLGDDSQQSISSYGDVSILDAGSSRWYHPTVGGDVLPKSRADTVLAYDNKSSRLIMFGGWANEWLNDIFTLDVAHVVGPPYAIMNIHPNIGPVTGLTPLQITGIDFANTKDVIVRFVSKCGSIDVPGEFLSSTQLVCTAPDFSAYPAGDVEVRVALNGDSFTTTSQTYTFFAVTSAEHSLIFGPGLLDGGACNEETMFIVQARDKLNARRTTGGDEFHVTIKLIGGSENGEDLLLRSGVQMRSKDDGTYHVHYTAPSPGSYYVEVAFMGTFGGLPGPLRGSEVAVRFDEFVPRSNNSMTGKLVASELTREMQALTEINKSIAAGIYAKTYDEKWTDEQSRRALVSVKEHLNMIRDKKNEVGLLVDRLDCTLSYLKSQGINNGPLEKELAAQRTLWEKAQQEAPSVSLKITPLIKAQGARTKNDIHNYECIVQKFVEDLESAPFQLYEIRPSQALSLLATMTSAYEKEQIRCREMIHLANMFECQSDMDVTTGLLAKAGEQLGNYHCLWTCAEECSSYIEEACGLIWHDLNADGLEENAKLILAKVKHQPNIIKHSDVYRGLERTAKDFLIACPLITSLRQPYMRNRHWDELREIISAGGAALRTPTDYPQLKLGDVIRAKLHLQVGAVGDVTDRASREAAHEETLQGLSDTWNNVQFNLTYYMHTDVPLLKMSEEDSDQLESDQLALQSMVASRYKYFQPQAVDWQGALVTISDVVQTLSEIQRTWSYLEPLFIGSEEVKRELPAEAHRFAAIDEQVRMILKNMAETRNVRDACRQVGLLKRLECMNADQDVCKKALADFLAGKRRVFPR